MASPLYSLRWNNHQSHMLHAFDTLLQSEALVDVTLVCEDTRRLRAHKVVLSACSPFFEKIFAETPCKHPVIVLKDIRSYELQGIVDFMYKGEISVLEEQLPNLMKAAESLQIRGLYHNEPSFAQSPPHVSLERFSQFSPHQLPSSGPSAPPHGSLQSSFLKDDINGPALSPYSPDGGLRDRSPLRLPVMPLSFGNESQNSGTPTGDHYCASPLPRRKQARPRRRSGEQGSGSSSGNGTTPLAAGGQAGPQDLSKAAAAPATAPQPAPARSPAERLADVAENLSTKRGRPSSVGGSGGHSSRQSTPAPGPAPAPATTPLSGDESQSTDVPLDMMAPERRDFNHLGDPASHSSLISHRPDSGLDNPAFASMTSLSALALTTPPHGLFPGMDAVRNPLLSELPEARAENHLSSSSGGGGNTGGGGGGGGGNSGKRSKSKWNDVNRPKGQHSAPRGGPPRSWTNAELTEALQQVWNKKMTTSQASRIFGIPYNSLLMYVRGKYGKSLKLEQLRKDCQGGPMTPLELLGLGPPPLGHNNNISKDHSHPLDEAPTGLGGADQDVLAFNPYHQGANFYPEFGAFPLSVSMMHLLPQTDKSRAAALPPPHPASQAPAVSLPMALDFTSFRQSDKDIDREELLERERERAERERDAERERKRERKAALREQQQQQQQQQQQLQQQQQRTPPPPPSASPSSPTHIAAPENNNAADHPSKLMILDELPKPAPATEVNGQE